MAELKGLAALRAARFASVCKGSWLSVALDLAQMVLEVGKNPIPIKLYMLNIFDFYNYPQKSSPGVVLALGLLLAVYGPGPGPDCPGGLEVP